MHCILCHEAPRRPSSLRSVLGLPSGAPRSGGGARLPGSAWPAFNRDSSGRWFDRSWRMGAILFSAKCGCSPAGRRQLRVPRTVPLGGYRRTGVLLRGRSVPIPFGGRCRFDGPSLACECCWGAGISAEEALASDPPPRSKLGLVARKADPKVKRHTVASVAAEQANLVSLVANLARQVQTLVEQREAPQQVEVSTPLPHREAHHQVEVSPPMPQDQLGFAPGLQAHSGASLNPLRQALARPLSAMAPPLQATPKNLAQVLGPPPSKEARTRALRHSGGKCSGWYHWRRALGGRGGQGPPVSGSDASTKQSLDRTCFSPLSGSGSSCRLGSSLVRLHSRDLLQAEVPSRTSAERRGFFEEGPRCSQQAYGPGKLNAGSRGDWVGHVQVPGTVRRLWFAKGMGLVQWQLAQVMDLAAGGHWESALDHVALLMIMVEQTALDSGRTDLSWLLTLQPDPPSSIFLNHQSLPTSSLRPFAPLADQRLIASTLAYVKELDTLSTKRAELTAPKSKPGPPVPSPSGLRTSDQPVLTKKQLRAKAWAEKKAAAAAQN